MKTSFFQKMGVLWREFIPLSMSDVTMALGDPLVNTTLAQMPRVQMNFAALGVVKALVVLFESPIIMLLHASNTLANKREAQAALFRFVVLSSILLTCLLIVLAIPPVFFAVTEHVMGIPAEIAEVSHGIFLCLLPWPAAIAWRRYFQGILISHGYLKPVAHAGILRLIVLSACLVIGYKLNFSGSYVAGAALMLGIMAEACAIIFIGIKYQRHYLFIAEKNAHLNDADTAKNQPPKTLAEIWKFYWPLAYSMVLVWGARALLVVFLARAVDGPLALAIWPAAWALIVVFGNATRMVQQVIIRNKYKYHPMDFIFFAISVGFLMSSVLFFSASSAVGKEMLVFFVGKDAPLLAGVQSVLLVCFSIPIVIAVQNAFQGFLIGTGKTKQVNVATLTGVGVLLLCAFIGVFNGYAGAYVAAISMLISLSVEIFLLALFVPWKNYSESYFEQQKIIKGISL